LQLGISTECIWDIRRYSAKQWSPPDRKAETRSLHVYPHPRLVLKKVPEIPRITTPSERANILELLGVDILILAEFTLEFAQLSPEEFLQNILVEELGTRDLFVGENYRFGKDRAEILIP